MLTPMPWNLALYPGFTFDPTFEFFTDTAYTDPFDLTGYTAVLTIGNGQLVLSPGNGLTLGGNAGTIEAVATATQTANLLAGEFNWQLQWTSPGGGETDCPIAGRIVIGTPGEMVAIGGIQAVIGPGLTVRAVVGQGVSSGYVQGQVALEATRATGAEGALGAGLGAEVTRAMTAEGVNAAAIAAETTRATTAEATKASTAALTTETARATAAEGANATAITGEAATRAAADAAETARATTAEGLLIPLAQKAVASGVGSLDNTGRQPIGQAPLAVGFGSSGNPNTAGVFNPLHPTYGAVADCKTVTDGVIATGNKFSTTLGALTNADVGKTVCCVAAGTATVPFTATISSVAAGVGTLSASATNNGTGLTAWYGTDNTTVLQAVVNAASACAITATGGGTVDLGSAGAYLTQTIVPASNVTLKSEGAALVKHPASTDGIISNRTGLAAFSNFRVLGVPLIGEGQFAGDTTITTTDRRGAIGVYNCSNVTVRDCSATGFAFQGFALVNCTGSLIVRDNTLSNVCAPLLGNAIHVTTTIAPTGPVNGVITGNVVTGCQMACVCVQAQAANASAVPYNITVHDNPNLTTSAFAAIAVEIGSSPTTNYTIRVVHVHHNVCTQTATAGSGTYGITVSDNSSGGTYSTDANEFLDVLLDHNIISSNDGGILCSASYAQIDHNNVAAQFVGINAANNSANNPAGQIIDTNIVRMTSPNFGTPATTAASGTGTVTSLTVGALAVAVPKGALFVIQGDTNTIKTMFTTTAAAIAGATTLAVSAPSITTTIAAGNIVWCPSHGVVAVGVDKPTVKGNTVTYLSTVAGSADGVHISSCTRPTADNNIVNYAPQHGVAFTSSSDCHSNGNRVYNPNTGAGSFGSGLAFLTCTAAQRTMAQSNDVLDDRGTILAYTGVYKSGGTPRLVIADNSSWGMTFADQVTNDASPSVRRFNTSLQGSTPAVVGLGTISASPFTYQNTNPYAVEFVISGGTVSAVTKKRGSSAAEPMPVAAGAYHLEINETLVITYSVVPTNCYVFALNQC